jgi:hypothetical protein
MVNITCFALQIKGMHTGELCSIKGAGQYFSMLGQKINIRNIET